MMRREWLTSLALLAWGAGCVKTTGEFHCATSDDCVHAGVAGTCEAATYCSFPDGNCTSGARYGEFSGPYANHCVGEEPPMDAPTDSTDGSMIDAPANCPGTYAALPGVPTHVYRLIAVTATWDAQKSDCDDDSVKSYFAVPDDPNELAAIMTNASPKDVWVGINDKTNDGTFKTVLGGDPFAPIPWNGANPNLSGPGCVVALTGQPTATAYDDQKCNMGSVKYYAMCECNP